MANQPRGPVAISMNYAMLGDDVVIRASERSSQAAGRGQPRVSFEVHHLYEALAEGWSVLVSGEARIVTDPPWLDDPAFFTAAITSFLS
jgi:nitroimidazol reductase NimA-like FMN-containing flavoprotein (pyridoxamine 5'-phosphate oxidase superfamily)